jgi:hypothetical protein
MGRDGYRFRIDAGYRLDVNQLARIGMLRFEPGIRVVGSIQYRCGLELEITAERYNDEPRLILAHSGIAQYVSLASVPKPYGGQQWYLLCPVTFRRVSVLWCPYGARKFASRHAYRNAAYNTQFLDPTQRCWRELRRVAKRLGSTDPDDYDLPEKPKWMRWSTYERLADRHDAANEKLDQQIVIALSRLLKVSG